MPVFAYLSLTAFSLTMKSDEKVGFTEIVNSVDTVSKTPITQTRITRIPH